MHTNNVGVSISAAQRLDAARTGAATRACALGAGGRADVLARVCMLCMCVCVCVCIV